MPCAPGIRPSIPRRTIKLGEKSVTGEAHRRNETFELEMSMIDRAYTEHVSEGIPPAPCGPTIMLNDDALKKSEKLEGIHGQK
jgi:hypothetical protein